jgi:hypothetical protein
MMTTVVSRRGVGGPEKAGVGVPGGRVGVLVTVGRATPGIRMPVGVHQ